MGRGEGRARLCRFVELSESSWFKVVLVQSRERLGLFRFPPLRTAGLFIRLDVDHQRELRQLSPSLVERASGLARVLTGRGSLGEQGHLYLPPSPRTRCRLRGVFLNGRRLFRASQLNRTRGSRGRVRPRVPLRCSFALTGAPTRPTALYILHRLLSSCALTPLWAFLHFTPLSPYPAVWTLPETLRIRWMTRLTHVVSRCDLKLAQRDHTVLPTQGSLKETRAIWIPPAGEEWLTGIGNSADVATIRVPGYIWGEGKEDVGEMGVGRSQNVMLFLHGGGLAVGSAHEKDITAGASWTSFYGKEYADMNK